MLHYAELDEVSHRLALAGLRQIIRWSLAQQSAQQHDTEVERFAGLIAGLQEQITALATTPQREILGTVQTAGRTENILTAAGAGRARHLNGLRDEISRLETARHNHESQRDSMLAIPCPGPDVIPGLAEWITTHLIDRPEYRFKG